MIDTLHSFNLLLLTLMNNMVTIKVCFQWKANFEKAAEINYL